MLQILDNLQKEDVVIKYLFIHKLGPEGSNNQEKYHPYK